MGIPRKVSELGRLSPAELQVLGELLTGETITLGNGSVPTQGDVTRQVRAALIRLLLLGNDPDHFLHEKGLRISGAWVLDPLDLEGCRIPREISLVKCRFGGTLLLRSAAINGLFLNDCILPQLLADRLEARVGISLRGIKTTGPVRLPGATLGGDLDCSGATFHAREDVEGWPNVALTAEGIEARGGIILRDVNATGEVRLVNASLGGDLSCSNGVFCAHKDAQGNARNSLVADRLKAGGAFFLGVKATGAVRFSGATLGGNLECDGASFSAGKKTQPSPGNAIYADGLTAHGSVFLRNGFDATGTVRLVGAKLGGNLECDGANFRAQSDDKGLPGDALNAEGLNAQGNVSLRGVKATGTVRLSRMKLGGVLSCTGATFCAETDVQGNSANALSAESLDVGGSVFLRKVVAKGTVLLSGTKLGGSLDCEGATFLTDIDKAGNPSDALSADLLEAREGVSLRNVNARGEVRLLGAKLGGDLECIDATFCAITDASGQLGDAFVADGMEASGTVFFRKVKANSVIRLPGSKLTGNLECVDLTIGTEGHSHLDKLLIADGLKIDGSMFFEEVSLTGQASFVSAQIGRNLICSSLQGNLGRGLSLDLRAAIVGNVLFLPEAEPGGRLILSGAKIGSFQDTVRALAAPDKVWMNGCEYGGFVGTGVDVPVEARIGFLSKQYDPDDPADFYPQPYEQLAGVLRTAGHGEDARAVLIEKERRQRAARRARADGVAKVWFGFWDWLLGVTVRYGRQPLWAFYWLLCFWLVGVAVFGVAEAKGALKPNKEVVLRSEEWIGCAAAGPEAQAGCYLLTDRGASYPRFNRWIYSADTLLPIVSLEVQEYWIPDDRKEWPGWGSRGYLWLHIAVGWALSLLAVAGFSGLVKSD